LISSQQQRLTVAAVSSLGLGHDHRQRAAREWIEIGGASGQSDGRSSGYHPGTHGVDPVLGPGQADEVQ
jgi:hypothetical protein